MDEAIRIAAEGCVYAAAEQGYDPDTHGMFDLTKEDLEFIARELGVERLTREQVKEAQNAAEVCVLKWNA